MAYSALAKLKKNSISTTTTGDLLVGTTTIPVAETACFHNEDGTLITKGIVIGYNVETETQAEEITITGASTTSGAGNLTGVTRAVNADGAVNGIAYAWPSGSRIAVKLSTGIWEQLIGNIAAIYTALIYGYKELTVLQAIIPDNNAATIGQGAELGNGVNFAWASFSHSAAARIQWVIPMPADWDGGTITAIIGWTCAGTAGGTVKWTLKGYRVGDDGTLNATLGTLGSLTDTFIAANDLHLTAESSALTVGGSGNLLLLELIRDYANDTDTDAALFISLRLKYGRTV
jgi:hypothetical protein